jgi:hypothetical protein
MFRIAISVRGMLAAAMKTTDDEIASRAQSCLVDALREWVTRRASPGMRDRFGPGAYASRGFTHRNEHYERRQAKYLPGGIQPYAKPKKTNYLRLALAVSKVNPKRILRELQDLVESTPMRQAVFVEGSGFNVASNAGSARSGNVNGKLTLPGANKMNRGGNKGAIFRRELLDLSLGGGVDRVWIMNRTEELFRERVMGFLTAFPRIKLAG